MLKLKTKPPREDLSSIELLQQKFGDLIYDLFCSILWTKNQADTLYLRFWKETEKTLHHLSLRYEKNARAWILQSAVDLVIKSHQKQGGKISPSERIALDQSLNVPVRLKNIRLYLRRLSSQDQILLALRDRYGIPYSEVASILRIPEGALRTKHQQALRSLEEWLWDHP